MAPAQSAHLYLEKEVLMDRFFSDIGIRAVDFVYISVVFILTMAVFFGVSKKHIWLSYVLTVTFAIICVTNILAGPGLNVRLFAALMLISTAVVEVVVSWKKSDRARNTGQ
jgi:hypothetical protein